MRDPKLCEYWQLAETGPRTYDLVWLLNAHEAMDMEDEMQRRAESARKQD
jgi:hypothetical protein